jgi:hypothetical protein
VSGLPEGDPASHGQSLDPEIPGTNTYAKPVNDVRHDEPEPGSIYRKDGPGDLAKPQDGGGSGDDGTGDTRDHGEFKPTFNGPGGRPKDDPTVTDVPYRDGRPNKHMASMGEIVAGLFLLRFAHEALLRPQLRVRVAATLGQIIEGLDPEIESRGNACSVSVRRVDSPNLRWLFSVNCGNGAKVVRVKAERTGNVVRLAKMHLRVSCSCPAWRWLGPEYQAKQYDYLDGSPRGTASPPAIRDPEHEHSVCKHVMAVINTIRRWEIPLPDGVKGTP